MKPYFKPSAGKMVVRRDQVQEVTRGIVKTDEMIAYESYWNPWGVVLAIGDPVTLDNGTSLESEFMEGDRIAFARMGHDLKLTAPDGTETEVYVLAWEGGYGGLRMKCEVCNAEVRNADDLADPECPNSECPSHRLIEEPTISEVAHATATKRR